MRDEVFLQLLLVSATTTPLIILLKFLGNKLSNHYVTKWKYYVWLVLAVRLLIPWSLSLPVQPLEVVIPQEVLISEEPVFLPESLTMTQEEWFLPEELVLEQFQMTQMPDTESTEAENAPRFLNWRGVMEAGQVFWLAGALGYLGYHLVANIHNGRKLWRWSGPAKEELALQIQEAVGERNLPKHLAIRVSHQVKGPLLVGLLYPRLYLPERAFEREELEFILRHEMTHYQRKDLWYKALLLLVNGLHWFNPFVYMMCREAEKDLECSCDSIIMSDAGREERGTYAKLILQEAAIRTYDYKMLSSNFYSGKGELKMRMQNILDGKKKKRGRVTLGIVVAIAIIGSGLWNFSLEKSEAREYSAAPLKDVVVNSQVSEKDGDEKQQEAMKQQLVTKCETMEKREGMMLDKTSGGNDKLVLYRVDNGEESYNMLAVMLECGLTATYKLPGNYENISDDSHIYTLPLQSDYYESIVVRLSDPKAEGLEADTDYYVLHVEVDQEKQKAQIVEDLAILSKMTGSKNYDGHKDTFVEMPFYYVTHPSEKVMRRSEKVVHYHEELGQTTLKIRGYTENVAEVVTSYVYWDGEDWQIYIE